MVVQHGKAAADNRCSQHVADSRRAANNRLAAGHALAWPFLALLARLAPSVRSLKAGGWAESRTGRRRVGTALGADARPDEARRFCPKANEARKGSLSRR